MPEKITRFRDIPQFLRSNYAVDVSWTSVPGWLEEAEAYGTPIDFDPDFQRGHVWTPEQRSRYLEFCLRGGVGARDIYFNFPGWLENFQGEFVVVDGKQRLTSVLMFLRDEIPVFGSLYSEFTDRLTPLQGALRFHVNTLRSRREVLQWYLDLNAGGVVHTEDELDRVRKLIRAEPAQ